MGKAGRVVVMLLYELCRSLLGPLVDLLNEETSMNPTTFFLVFFKSMV